MTLTDLAKRANVEFFKHDDPNWEGKWAYKPRPSTTVKGFRTKAEALEHWLYDTYGEHNIQAIKDLIAENQYLAAENKILIKKLKGKKP